MTINLQYERRDYMYWKEIRRSDHFEEYHKETLVWSDVVRLIYTIKNKRKRGDKLQIEDNRFYILCEVKNKILYVINVRKKK